MEKFNRNNIVNTTYQFALSNNVGININIVYRSTTRKCEFIDVLFMYDDNGEFILTEQNKPFVHIIDMKRVASTIYIHVITANIDFLSVFPYLKGILAIHERFDALYKLTNEIPIIRDDKFILHYCSGYTELCTVADGWLKALQTAVYLYEK